MSFDQEPSTAVTKADVDKTLQPSHSGFMGITGLEGIPMSVIGMPRVKLVQPVSQNVELTTGNDATPGTFFFSDSLTSKPEIELAILTAKKSMVTFNQDDGTTKDVERVAILFQELESSKLYLTDLSVTSFSAFGKLMGVIAAEEWETAWDKAITVSSEKVEGKKGKYFIFKFTLGEALSEAKQSELAELWTSYGGYFTHEGEMFEEA